MRNILWGEFVGYIHEHSDPSVKNIFNDLSVDDSIGRPPILSYKLASYWSCRRMSSLGPFMIHWQH